MGKHWAVTWPSHLKALSPGLLICTEGWVWGGRCLVREGSALQVVGCFQRQVFAFSIRRKLGGIFLQGKRDSNKNQNNFAFNWLQSPF